MNRLVFGLLTILNVILIIPLQSEVEKAVLKWNPGYCTESCLKNLTRRLQSMHDVAEVKMEGESSQATLRWKPNKPFSFQAIDYTMRYVGVRMMQVFVTVRGTILHADKNASIVSIGDNTPFLLLSPTDIKAGQAAALQNIQSYKLKPEMRNKLILAEQQYKVVTIEGLLLLPERGPPLYMIIQNISIPPSLNESNQTELLDRQPPMR